MMVLLFVQPNLISFFETHTIAVNVTLSFHFVTGCLQLSFYQALTVAFLIARNTSVALGTESWVIRTSSPQEDESPAQTPILLESCWLCRVLMTYAMRNSGVCWKFTVLA